MFPISRWKIFNAQPDRRIAEDHEIPRIVARDPHAAQLVERCLAAKSEIELRLGELGRERRPPGIEDVRRLADAVAAHAAGRARRGIPEFAIRPCRPRKL